MRLAPALALLSLASLAQAQPATAPTFTPEGFRAHVEFLSHDLLEGRDTGTRGYDIAARYVATRFQALGLKPGAGADWYQQVPFAIANLGSTAPTVTIGGRTFTHGQDVLVGPTALEAAQSVEAPVVFVGYGLDSPAQGFNDYRGLDVRGKIVAVLSGTPRGTPSEMGAHLNADKARMARSAARSGWSPSRPAPTMSAAPGRAASSSPRGRR
jgi:hypothetical protein